MEGVADANSGSRGHIERGVVVNVESSMVIKVGLYFNL
jgi:hypothetical protein